MNKRKYTKPAIKEAIFEAKFDFSGFDNTTPGQIFDQIKSDYPTKQDIKHEVLYLGKQEVGSTEKKTSNSSTSSKSKKN